MRDKKISVKEIDIVETQQSIYDGFNDFIISSDLKVFGKLLARTQLVQAVKDIHGDIVECGVFKGSGLLSFLKLKRYLCPNSSKKVIGFDFFNSDQLIQSLNGDDKNVMSALFETRNFSHKIEFAEALKNKIMKLGFFENEFELVSGDVCNTTKQFVDERPGARISLLYLDLDLDVPTYESLVNLWPRVSSGGIVVFDEYGHHSWSESNGVDRFLKEHGLKLQVMNFICPTAMIVKE